MAESAVTRMKISPHAIEAGRLFKSEFRFGLSRQVVFIESPNAAPTSGRC